MKKVLIVEETPGFGGSTACIASALRNMDTKAIEFYVSLSYHDTSRDEQYFNARKVYEIRRNDLTPRLKTVRTLQRFFRKFGMISHRIFSYLLFLINIIIDHFPRLLRHIYIIRKHGIDLVHTNTNIRANMVGILAAKLTGRPCISHIRNFERIFGFPRWFIEKDFMHSIIVQSDVQKEDLVLQGVAEEKIVRIYEALEDRELDYAYERDYLFRQFGLASDVFTLGIVGMLTDWKGHDVLINAVGKIKDQLGNFALIIIGDTITAQDLHKKKLMELADELGLKKNVIFAGQRSDVKELLGGLDIFIHASKKPEPFGRVIIEAMVAGRAVIASRAGGPLEIIDDESDGFLFEIGDSDDLAQTILRLSRDTALRRRLGKKAREKVFQKFRQTTSSKELEAHYMNVLTSSGRQTDL